MTKPPNLRLQVNLCLAQLPRFTFARGPDLIPRDRMRVRLTRHNKNHRFRYFRDPKTKNKLFTL